MSREEQLESLKSISDAELRIRKQVLVMLIDANQKDDRIDEPKRQLEIIQAEIDRREIDETTDVEVKIKQQKRVEPEDIVIGLDTLSMSAQPAKFGGK